MLASSSGARCYRRMPQRSPHLVIPERGPSRFRLVIKPRSDPPKPYAVDFRRELTRLFDRELTRVNLWFVGYRGQVLGLVLSALGGGRADFEAEAVIARFRDLAVVGEAVEHGVVILASPKTPANSLKLRFVVITTEARS